MQGRSGTYDVIILPSVPSREATVAPKKPEPRPAAAGGRPHSSSAGKAALKPGNDFGPGAAPRRWGGRPTNPQTIMPASGFAAQQRGESVGERYGDGKETGVVDFGMVETISPIGKPSPHPRGFCSFPLLTNSTKNLVKPEDKIDNSPWRRRHPPRRRPARPGAILTSARGLIGRRRLRTSMLLRRRPRRRWSPLRISTRRRSCER